MYMQRSFNLPNYNVFTHAGALLQMIAQPRPLQGGWKGTPQWFVGGNLHITSPPTKLLIGSWGGTGYGGSA